jgi:DNA-binding MarR family transcriptional regulator
MRTTSTLDLAVRLRLAITRTSRRLRQEAGPGLSPSLTSALATVDRHGPLTPSELAARERVQRPTATRLVARLEELGVLQRAADPADRRSSLLTATPQGHALLEELCGRKTAYLAHRLEGLDAEEQAALDRAAAILERLLEEDDRA